MRFHFYPAFILMLLTSLALGFYRIPNGNAAQVTAAPAAGGGVVTAEIHHDQSRPLRDLPIISPPVFNSGAVDLPYSPLFKSTNAPSGILPSAAPLLAPSTITAGTMPLTSNQWDGINKRDGVLPPDTNGDVGPNHYVQWVNLSLQIWNKQGVSIFGPIAGNMLWSGFGGPCELRNNGDPIVLYDPLADRWFASQFMLAVPYYQCIAVSATPDPTGAWYRYAFQWSQTKMNDYPKFGVWPDGYYMSVNQYDSASNFKGAGVAVFERERMLKGEFAQMISFDLFAADKGFGGMLPADLDGRQAPPVGAPNPFVEWDDESYGLGGGDALRVWDFHVDWANTALSTFGNHLQPNVIIPTANVDPGITLGYWITQPDSFMGLDPISDRLMYRLQYRNFGDHQVLVSNHTVNAGNIKAGIDWFELRKIGAGDWSLYQEGLHAPDTTRQRWMGSIAMDASGNIALGYSLSGNLPGSATYPSIAYAGRLAADPLGALPQSEVLMIAGGGSQLGSNRWGDYSMMAVDPSDECTFWYTQEYYSSSSNTNWRTRIGAFKFPSCNQPATGLLQGTVRSGGLPVSGATVTAGGSSVYTGTDGTYSLLLAAGSQALTVSLFGMESQSTTAMIVQGGTTLLNFNLIPIVLVQISGKVSDGAGHAGMPLYARLDIAGVPASPILTDPQTGQYQVILPVGETFQFNVSAVNGGYLAENRAVTVVVGGSVENSSLHPDPSACPLGYILQTGACQVVVGGLVVGKVRDTNQPPHPAPLGLAGALVKDAAAGTSATAGANPAGLFFLFTSTGTRSLSAEYAGYTTKTLNVAVLADQAAAQNFDLPSAYLQVSPQAVNLTVDRLAPAAEANLVFSNQGTIPGSFSLTEFNGPVPLLAANGPFASAGRRLSPKRTGELTAQNIYEYTPPPAPLWPGAGEALRSWATTGLMAPWGLGAGPNGEIWVSDALSGGGDGRIHRFGASGEPQGISVPDAYDGAFSADLAYDPLAQRFWQINAGGSDCIYRFDPQAAGGSAEKICPPLGNSQRGLAYDPRSQTFYSGSWNDAILNHFDRSGKLLDSINTGINISGLAYHPVSGHLYVLSNSNVGFDVYVLDVRSGYAILGGFDIAGMTGYGQAGLEFDGQGHLWAVDFKSQQVIEVTSGEGALYPLADVPWLVVTPASATLQPGGTQSVALSLDASAFTPGLYQAYLNVTTDTPYDISPYKIGAIPVNLTVAPVRLSPAVQTGYARAGRTFVYQLVITNILETSETFNVELGPHAWTSSAPSSVGPLAPGATVQVAVSVTVPPGTPPAQFEALTVSVALPANLSARRSVSLKTVAAWIYIFPVIGR